MTRYLVEEGVARRAETGNAARRRDGRGVHRIPEGIREAIGARLNRLPPCCNEVLPMLP